MAVSLDTSVAADLAQWDRMDSLAKDLARTLEDERFPGAIVPAVRSNGDPVFYALAGDGVSWRRLQPLLTAFAGPTFTDFEGVPTELDEKEPIEKFLAGVDLHAVSVLRPKTSERSVNAALRALTSLQNAISRAPDVVGTHSEPTSILLARLQDDINGKDMKSAWRTHSTLKDELRLDAKNLLQLEFKIHAASGDWKKIRTHPEFELACAMKLAPVTAEVLLETLYWSHFQEEVEHRIPFLQEDVVQICHSLLDCIGKTTSPIVEKLIDLLSIEQLRPEASDKITKPTDYPEFEAVEFAVQENANDSLNLARTVFLTFAYTTADDVQSASDAVVAFDRLSEREQGELLSSQIFKAIWSEIQGRLGVGLPPHDWIEWMKRLEDPKFDASAYARVAPVEWRLPDTALDPLYCQNLVHAIEDVPAGMAGDRLDQSLPFFVDWVTTDPKWPRTSLCPVYLAFLTRIALSTRRGEKSIKSATLLLESALRCGLSASEYRDAMDAISMIASDAFSKYTAYDIFEFLEIASDCPIINEESLHDATVAVVSAARGHLDRLTSGQRLAYSHISARIGWTIESDDLDSTDEDPMTTTLSNLSVGIYTLTESAGRKARDVLMSLASDIKIELNHDHEATAKLGALVARVDLFVVAWASAKHAATNYIKSRRGSKPLIYAAGKGASSLIRVIEEYSESTK